MIYTLLLGAPVRKEGSEFGSLTRIIVENGVANRVVVNPSGLFTGPERVVPINAIAESSTEGITLNSTDVDWQSYNAYNLEQYLGDSSNLAPSIFMADQLATANPELPGRPPVEVENNATIVPMMVTLTTHTRVGDNGTLAGIVADTGIPTELLLAGGSSIPYAQVGILDEDHITLGPKIERMDDVTLPGSVGQPPDQTH